MSYTVSTEHCWYNDQKIIVRMYFLEGVPFTFDDVPDDGLYDLSLIDIASGEKRWEPEDVFRCSYYLMAEECHPLMYDVELENPEMMPVD